MDYENMSLQELKDAAKELLDKMIVQMTQK